MPQYRIFRTPRTLFCSATIFVSFMLSFALSFLLSPAMSFALPSATQAAREDAGSASPLFFPSAAGHAAGDTAEGTGRPHFILKDMVGEPGSLCRSCSGRKLSSGTIQSTTKEPFPMAARTFLPYAGSAESSTGPADAPLSVPLVAGNARNAADALADSAAAKPAVQNMVSKDLAQTLLLLVLPDAGCTPHPFSFEYTPANEIEKIVLSRSTPAMRPDMPEEDSRTKEKPAYRPLGIGDMAAVLHSLAGGRDLSEDRVRSLLGSAPGVLLRASSAYAAGTPADALPNAGQTEGSALDARQMLIVLTDPDCLFCRQAHRFLAGQSLPFPVLFLPAGSSASARDFYEQALRHPGASGRHTGSRKDVAGSWLAKTNDWLLQNSSKGTVSLPAFVWITDGTARMNTLSSKALQCLVTAMAWRYEGMMQHAAQKQAPRDAKKGPSPVR